MTLPALRPTQRTQIGRLIDNDRKERELALKAEAEKIYTHGCVDDDKRKRVRLLSLRRNTKSLTASQLQSKGEWGTARDKKEKGLDVLEAPALLEEAFARIQVCLLQKTCVAPPC